MYLPARRLIVAFWRLGLAAALPGCLGFAYHPHVEDLPEAAKAAGMRRLEVNAGRYMGISDLAAAKDAEGHPQLYMVPERQRALLGLGLPVATPPGRQDELLPTHVVARNIEGVPAYLDTESMAVLSPNDFALGTEAPWSDRDHDAILVVTNAVHPARVVKVLSFPYAPFGLRGEGNAGIEGLCFAANTLLAASETSGVLADGRRYAPLGHRGPGQDAFVPLRLLLSSETGRISALACRPGAAAGQLEVLAIERNYGLARILAFAVQTDAASSPALDLVVPRVALDLEPLLHPLRNYEGIAWLPNGDVLLVTDNSMGFATGPTEALLVPEVMLRPAAAP